MEINYLNGYRLMWLFVMFDLPTLTEANRKDASDFRKALLDEGFTMMQFSVYARHCSSSEHAESLEKRVSAFLPNGGKVFTFQITDKQYGNGHLYHGTKRMYENIAPERVVVFQSSLESFL